MPLVSVNVVTYNHEPFIRPAIQSVLDQTCADLEVVVVNDGSTDGTRQQIDAFTDPRVVAIHQENEGPAEATNRGLAACRGRFVALLSGDDLCHPDRLRRQLEEYGRGDRRVLFSGVDFIDDEGRPLTGRHYAADSFSQENLGRAGIFARLFRTGNYFNGITAFAERAVFLEGGGYDPVLLQLQDYDLWVRLVKKYDLWIMPDRLIHYRIRSDNQNLSSPEPAKQIASLNEQYLILRRFFDDAPLDLFRDAFASELRHPLPTTAIECAADQAFLFINAPHALARLIGLEKLAAMLNDPEGARVLRQRHGMTPVRFFAVLRSVNVLNLYAGHESAVFLDTGNGWNADERVATWTNLDWRDFSVTFQFPDRPCVRALRWDPMENRCCRIRIESVSYRDGNGQTRPLDVADLASNGQRLADGSVQFETVDPMFFLPVVGSVERLSIRGQWEHEPAAQTIHKLGQEVQHLHAALAEREQRLREQEGQLQRFVASGSWRVTAPLRLMGRYVKGLKARARGGVDRRRAS